MKTVPRMDVDKRKAQTNETWTKKDRGRSVVHEPESAGRDTVHNDERMSRQCFDRPETYLSLFLRLVQAHLFSRV